MYISNLSPPALLLSALTLVSAASVPIDFGGDQSDNEAWLAKRALTMINEPTRQFNCPISLTVPSEGVVAAMKHAFNWVNTGQRGGGGHGGRYPCIWQDRPENPTLDYCSSTDEIHEYPVLKQNNPWTPGKNANIPGRSPVRVLFSKNNAEEVVFCAVVEKQADGSFRSC